MKRENTKRINVGGVAGGKGKGILFKKGQVLGTYPYERLCDALTELIENDKEQQ